VERVKNMESDTREGIAVALAEEWELTLEQATEAVRKFFDEVRAE
jgi:hypothetical protein